MSLFGTWVGEFGLCPEQFWQQTPRTFHAIAQGRNRLAEREQRERLSLAWHVEAFARTKKLPKLKDVLKPARKKADRPQTWQEQLSIAMAWTAKFGSRGQGL